MSTTVVRIISASALVAILGFSYIVGEIKGLVYCASIVAVMAQFEFCKMVFKTDGKRYLLISLIIYTMCTLGTLWIFDQIFYVYFSAAFLGLVLIFATSRTHDSLDTILFRCSFFAIGYIYVGMLPSSVIHILYESLSIKWFLLLLVAVFSGDSFAYFVGRKLGSKRLWEKVSPKKTVEGAIGGLLGSIFVGTTFGYFFIKNVPILNLCILSGLLGISGQIGDLFESLLKRHFDIKDSGRLIPGHGGFLDRIDGVLFASPILFLYLQLF